jgi:hypothetical protein
LSGIALVVAMLALSPITLAFAQPTPSTRPVPGPIAGAGLPILVACYGAYCLVIRRYRRKSH